ncbi:GyrI-like domain-containing protein [Paenibacillus sp. y28]|uniref:GyrI-like domain-containing protein n=1 Tax=Paenibacillus sp. y28 TaxID=3129110 RepID=UPI00301A9A02
MPHNPEQQASFVEQVEQVEQIGQIHLEPMKLVGLSVTVAFENVDMGRIDAVRQQFFIRRNEIQGILHPDRYWSPWFSAEGVFTYFFCMEVADLLEIPEGMIGFTIPAHTYAKLHYDGPRPMNPDPYAVIGEYQREQGLAALKRALPLEAYSFAEWQQEGRIVFDVYVPLRTG